MSRCATGWSTTPANSRPLYVDELPDTAPSEGRGSAGQAALRSAADAVAGKVWSISVYARKPVA